MCVRSHTRVNAITCLTAKANQECKHAYKHESAASVYYHKYTHTAAQTVKFCTHKYASTCAATATPCGRKA